MLETDELLAIELEVDEDEVVALVEATLPQP